MYLKFHPNIYSEVRPRLINNASTVLPSLQVHEKDVQKFAPLTTSITREQLAIFFLPYCTTQIHLSATEMFLSHWVVQAYLFCFLSHQTWQQNLLSTIKYHKLAWTFFSPFLFLLCFLEVFFCCFFYLFCFLRGLLVMIILFLNHYVSFHCFILCVPYSYWPVELVLLPTKLADSD